MTQRGGEQLPSCMFAPPTGAAVEAWGGAGAGGGGGGGGGAGQRQKPPQMVARRNARERRRVQAVNTAFGRLRRALPPAPPPDSGAARGKRVSKVKTLHKAIEYIEQLEQLLMHQANQMEQISRSPDLNKENSGEVSNRWSSCESGIRASGCGADSIAQLLSEFHDF